MRCSRTSRPTKSVRELEHLPADPRPVRMGQRALSGSWRTPLDRDLVVAVTDRRCGRPRASRIHILALRTSRSSSSACWSALERCSNLARKSSRHSHTSCIVTTASSPHAHRGGFMSRLLLGGVDAARTLRHWGVGRGRRRIAGCGPPRRTAKGDRGKSSGILMRWGSCLEVVPAIARTSVPSSCAIPGRPRRKLRRAPATSPGSGPRGCSFARSVRPTRLDRPPLLAQDARCFTRVIGPFHREATDD